MCFSGPGSAGIKTTTGVWGWAQPVRPGKRIRRVSARFQRPSTQGNRTKNPRHRQTEVGVRGIRCPIRAFRLVLIPCLLTYVDLDCPATRPLAWPTVDHVMAALSDAVVRTLHGLAVDGDNAKVSCDGMPFSSLRRCAATAPSPKLLHIGPTVGPAQDRADGNGNNVSKSWRFWRSDEGRGRWRNGRRTGSTRTWRCPCVNTMPIHRQI